MAALAAQLGPVLGAERFGQIGLPRSAAEEQATRPALEREGRLIALGHEPREKAGEGAVRSVAQELQEMYAARPPVEPVEQAVQRLLGAIGAQQRRGKKAVRLVGTEGGASRPGDAARSETARQCRQEAEQLAGGRVPAGQNRETLERPARLEERQQETRTVERVGLQRPVFERTPLGPERAELLERAENIDPGVRLGRAKEQRGRTCRAGRGRSVASGCGHARAGR